MVFFYSLEIDKLSHMECYLFNYDILYMTFKKYHASFIFSMFLSAYINVYPQLNFGMNCFCQFFNSTLNIDLCKFILNIFISAIVKCSRRELANVILNDIIILIFKYLLLILLNFNRAIWQKFHNI